MKIIKTSSTQITPEQGQIENAYTESNENTYSCNYINGIVESGSNSNGEWIKFSNGVMICYGKKAITTTRNTSYASLYVSPKLSAIVYPQTFTEINSITLNAEASGNSVWILSADLGTLTSSPTYYIAGATSSSSTTYYISYIAIGKWK